MEELLLDTMQKDSFLASFLDFAPVVLKEQITTLVLAFLKKAKIPDDQNVTFEVAGFLYKE